MFYTCVPPLCRPSLSSYLSTKLVHPWPPIFRHLALDSSRSLPLSVCLQLLIGFPLFSHYLPFLLLTLSILFATHLLSFHTFFDSSFLFMYFHLFFPFFLFLLLLSRLGPLLIFLFSPSSPFLFYHQLFFWVLSSKLRSMGHREYINDWNGMH